MQKTQSETALKDFKIQVEKNSNKVYDDLKKQVSQNFIHVYMGQVTELQLSCYLVLLSIDSKTR